MVEPVISNLEDLHLPRWMYQGWWLSNSPQKHISLVEIMSLDNILYDLGRIASKAHIQIPCSGLDVWILDVRTRSNSTVLTSTDQTVERAG
jgi:hypothetical protein